MELLLLLGPARPPKCLYYLLLHKKGQSRYLFSFANSFITLSDWFFRREIFLHYEVQLYSFEFLICTAHTIACMVVIITKVFNIPHDFDLKCLIPSSTLTQLYPDCVIEALVLTEYQFGC